MRRFLVPSALAVLWVFFSNGADAQSYLSYGSQNLKGDVLVLDIGSIYYRGNHPYGPAIGNASICLDACKRVTGCNGYSYCNRTDGCGSGCAAYAKANPPAKTLPPSAGPGAYYSLDPNTKIPLKGFGPYDGCHWSDTNKWRYATCTLKVIPNVQRPQFWSTQDEGWLSGAIENAGHCFNVSARVCELCQKSANPLECLKCARSKGDERLQQALGYTNTLAEGCAQCYTKATGAALTKCLSCLTPKSACQPCVYQSSASTLPSCITCISQAPNGASQCLGCAAMTPTSAAPNCFSCVSQLKGYFCLPGGKAPGKLDKCVSEYDTCLLCAQAKDYNRCMGCLKANPYSRDCSDCQRMPSKYWDQCYKCAVNVTWGYSPCGSCYLNDDPVAPTNCFTCRQNTAISQETRSWCAICTGLPTAKRDKCLACIQDKKTTDFRACSYQ